MTAFGRNSVDDGSFWNAEGNAHPFGEMAKNYFADLAAFLAIREVLRAAVLRCIVPRLAARLMVDSAERAACLTSLAAPEDKAASNALTEVRISERTARFNVLRLAACRARLAADL